MGYRALVMSGYGLDPDAAYLKRLFAQEGTTPDDRDLVRRLL
jgi:hypothetical protein